MISPITFLRLFYIFLSVLGFFIEKSFMPYIFFALGLTLFSYFRITLKHNRFHQVMILLDLILFLFGFFLSSPILLTVSCLIRVGIFPFHTFGRQFFKLIPWNESLVLFLNPFHYFYFFRYLGPEIPENMTLLFLISSLAYALMALSEKDLRSLFFLISQSEISTALSGIAQKQFFVTVGTEIQMMVQIGTIFFFGLLWGQVLQKSKIIYGDDYYALGLSAPKTSLLFFILGFATVGVPGSFQFIGEDLIFHGIIDSFPLWGTALILSAVFNWVNFFRAYFQLFHGLDFAERKITDLNSWEVGTYSAVVLLIFLMGIFPQKLIFNFF